MFWSLIGGARKQKPAVTFAPADPDPVTAWNNREAVTDRHENRKQPLPDRHRSFHEPVTAGRPLPIQSGCPGGKYERTWTDLRSTVTDPCRPCRNRPDQGRALQNLRRSFRRLITSPFTFRPAINLWPALAKPFDLAEAWARSWQTSVFTVSLSAGVHLITIFLRLSPGSGGSGHANSGNNDTVGGIKKFLNL